MAADDTRVRLSHLVKCAGCAAKLSPVQLREALGGISVPSHPHLLIGADTLDDAAVFRIDGDLCLVHTADFFPPVVDDPELFGAIASANAMSDVWAMGGDVTTVVNLVSFPRELSLTILKGILAGAAAKVAEAGAALAGGHTIATEVLTFGQAVTGVVRQSEITANSGACPGDVLILAKALGTGIITTALKRDKISEEMAGPALASMSQLNQAAAAVMRRHQVRGATDVTGFGLLGHAMQVASASGVTFAIRAADVPMLPGALELSAAGVATGAAKTNREYVTPALRVRGSGQTGHLEVLLDPQTSGGMLISVAEHKAVLVLSDLRSSGYETAAIIGTVEPQREMLVEILYDAR